MAEAQEKYDNNVIMISSARTMIFHLEHTIVPESSNLYAWLSQDAPTWIAKMHKLATAMIFIWCLTYPSTISVELLKGVIRSVLT